MSEIEIDGKSSSYVKDLPANVDSIEADSVERPEESLKSDGDEKVEQDDLDSRGPGLQSED